MNLEEHVAKRIVELDAEIMELIEKLRVSKALYEELGNVYSEIVSQENFDKKEAEKISARMQKYFEENSQAQMLFKEKEAVLRELQSLIEEK